MTNIKKNVSKQIKTDQNRLIKKKKIIYLYLNFFLFYKNIIIKPLFMDLTFLYYK